MFIQAFFCCNMKNYIFSCTKITELYAKNAAVFMDAENLQYTCIPVISDSCELSRVQKYIQEPNRFSWFINENTEEKTAGFISALCNVEHKTATLSFVTDKDFQSKGVMTQCLPIIHSYLFTKKNIIRIEAQVYEHNTASILLLEKLGYQREGLLRKNFIIHRISRNSYMYSLLSS